MTAQAGNCPKCGAAFCYCDQEIRVHVIPTFVGEREHDESLRCWCGPRQDAEEPRVLVHERRAEA